ncbi:hypothetical protein [Pseudomonas lactis]|uniref:hypothetical protein n=1 Tax=Pseudomonas lactis TaxID=1615674 RepID=UPI001186475A|nr:hypothetical protein [Pseudomonas lactis]
MRNIQTREGFEFWDKLNALPRYAFLLSPSGNSVQKFEDQAMGNWIDVHEAQKVVDQAQDDINQFRSERDALQQRLTAADEQIDRLSPRHTEQPEGKRERFEKWVMATKHPVYGFLDGRSLARGDDRTGYADEYVQGLWVAYLAFGAEQPAPVAVVLPERKSVNTHNSHDWDEGHTDGWNAYDAELKRLNPSL